MDHSQEQRAIRREIGVFITKFIWPSDSGKVPKCTKTSDNNENLSTTTSCSEVVSIFDTIDNDPRFKCHRSMGTGNYSCIKSDKLDWYEQDVIDFPMED